MLNELNSGDIFLRLILKHFYGIVPSHMNVLGFPYETANVVPSTHLLFEICNTYQKLLK